MNPIIITPPLVQLNSPYPSGAYLKAFFSHIAFDPIWDDLNIEFFHELFSSQGLKKLFELTEEKAISMALEAEKNNDIERAFNLKRYLSSKEMWINWIDWIVESLTDGNKNSSNRELCHSFLFSPFVPRANRMEEYLASLQSLPSIDDLHFLCTLALADLADYIRVVFDSNFSLIQYASQVSFDQSKLSKINKELEAPVLSHYLENILNRKYSDLKENIQEALRKNNCPLLVLISLPFEGTFIPALYIARWFKKKYGNSVYVVLGGGFVNTELRNLKDTFYSEYFDALSFDRGYGSFKALLDFWQENKSKKKLYKLRQFNPAFLDCEALDSTSLTRNFSNYEDGEAVKKYIEYEDFITKEIVPDFSDIDFSLYPRVCDDKNAMHRLWTDGSWIKAYMAYGCYWHKCAFCDTKLDYVCSYKPVNIEKLFNCLYETSLQKGIRGIHFVDEALPPALLKQFSLLNVKKDKQLYYWGNVRFEKTFSKDLAAFLSYCGLGAVSGGIEVATDFGLKNINKGTDIDSIVSSCAAFKEAGILVHSYMIYGFWYDTPQSIIDSMETLRQLFLAGLLDSAFWHQFMLTKNSALYEDLKDKWKGGKEFDKYGKSLDYALSCWMKGEGLNKKVQKWFDFPLPPPSIPENYVGQAIEKYEEKSKLHDRNFDNLEALYWLGSKTLLLPYKNSFKIEYFYLMEMESVIIQSGLEKLADYLWDLRPSAPEENRREALNFIKKNKNIIESLKKFRSRGLVLL